MKTVIIIVLAWTGCLSPTCVGAAARGSRSSGQNNDLSGSSDHSHLSTGAGRCSVRADGTTKCLHDGIARGSTYKKKKLTQEKKELACQDFSPDCSERAEDDGCIADFFNMQEDCPQTCLLCDNIIGRNHFAIYNEVPQDIPSSVEEERIGTMEVIEATEEFMFETIYKSNEMDVDVMIACKNRHWSCSFWSSVGECENNASFMELNCGPACQTCARVTFEQRCPVDDELLETSVWGPGDLNSMFEEIVEDEDWQSHNLQILSQPIPSAPGILEGPWVITIDDFLTPDECDTLIELGAQKGYERSQDLSNEMNFDGTFDGVVSADRTSTNAWCDDECFDHEVNQRVLARIEELIGIPEQNYEHLQLLRYEKGQRYGVHHDFIESQVARAPGPRILTVFLYLNDVEAGGGTNFPELDLTVQPKRGRALLWPSVLDEDPDLIDNRTDHQALPVEAGIKYGANAWVHMRDFKTPLEDNCH